MKIIVLGSSADKGFFHRKGKNKRTRASIAVQKKDSIIVIDASPDFFRQIEREKIIPDAIVLTHAHIDHIAALKIKKVYVPVYASKETWEEMPKKIASNCLDKKIIDKQTKIDGLKITPFKVDHSDLVTTYGYKINGLVYIPEQRRLTKEAEKYMNKAKILVLDGAIMDRDLQVHTSIKTKLKWLPKIKAQKIYFTNIGRNTAKKSHKQLEQFLKQKDQRVGVFYDGQIINF